MDNSTETFTCVRTEVEPCHVRLDIEIAAERVTEAFEEAVSTVARQARVPGFRPGKAPRKLLLRHYGEHVEQECRRKLIREAFESIPEEEVSAMETVPRVDDEENLRCEPGESFVFSFSFDVEPQFELPPYQGITISRDSTVVDDRHVDEAIDGWLQQRASFDKVDRPAEMGDMLKVDYEGTLEEEVELPETANFFLSSQGSWVALRPPELIPGINEALVGLQSGDTREVEVEFPDDFNNEELAGKKAHYTFTVLEVHGVQTPELTEELAQSVGAESIQDMRDRVKKSLEEQQEKRQKDALRAQLLNVLLGDLDFPFPPARFQVALHHALMRLYDAEVRAGATEEQVAARLDELRADAERTAKRTLTRYYVLKRIARAEGIEPDMAKVTELVQAMAQMSGVPVKTALRRLGDGNRLDEIVSSVLEEQVLDRLLEWANVVESASEQE